MQLQALFVANLVTQRYHRPGPWSGQLLALLTSKSGFSYRKAADAAIMPG
jgi:hypothetical protein